MDDDDARDWTGRNINRGSHQSPVTPGRTDGSRPRHLLSHVFQLQAYNLTVRLIRRARPSAERRLFRGVIRVWQKHGTKTYEPHHTACVVARPPTIFRDRSRGIR